MSHLWFVMRLYGSIIGTIGPWADDAGGYLACQSAAHRAKDKADSILDEWTAVTGRPVTVNDITVTCEQFEAQPQMGDPK